jgi:hypothetical protein
MNPSGFTKSDGEPGFGDHYMHISYHVEVSMSSGVPPFSMLIAIRAAHHPEETPSYDRVVFEFSGPVPQINIQYVPQLIADGSGAPIPIAGSAILQLRFSPARAHNEQGQPTAPGRIAFTLPSIKEVVRSGDFEGVVSYGVGLSTKREIRVLTLTNASRVVVDFRHS